MTQPFTPVRSLPAEATSRQITDAINQILKNFPQFGSADYRGIRTVTHSDSPVTVLASDHTLLCDCTAGAITVNLPAVATNAWRIIAVKKIDTTNTAVTTDANASETIDGALTQTITTQWGSLVHQNDGASWYLIGWF